MQSDLLLAHARFIGHGEEFRVFCTSCGARNDEAATRCANCGETLRRVETSGGDVSPPPNHGLSSASSGASTETVPNVKNYLVQAVVLTIVCFVLAPFTLFFPFIGVITGIVAIVYAAQVNGKVAGRNYAGAAESSRLAKIWCWITFAFVLIEVAILLLLVFLVFLAALL